MKKKIILLTSFVVIAGSGILYAINTNSSKAKDSCCAGQSSCCTEQSCTDCSCGDECTGSGCECGCTCCE